jgi:hypothetical protein
MGLKNGDASRVSALRSFFEWDGENANSIIEYACG